MKTLDIDLIDEKTGQLLGKLQIHEIGQLSCIDSIRGCFSAFDEFQVKTADVFVDIQLNQAKGKLITLIDQLKNIKNFTLVGQIDFNEQKTQSLNSSIDGKTAKGSPGSKKKLQQMTTPASLDNITNFNTKYNTFENEQMKRFDADQLNSELAKPDNNSRKNMTISSLIERGEALKNEMIKSAANLNKPHIIAQTNVHNNNNFMDSSSNQLKIPYEQSFILPKSTSNFNEFIDDDFSMLSGSMHDPEILSALVYNQLDIPGAQPYSFQDKSNSESFNEDAELKELLEPTSDVLLSKMSQKMSHTYKPIVANNSQINQDKTQQQLENIKKYLKSINSYDNQSLDTDIENYLRDKASAASNANSHNNTRVSFEIQSSDNETCASSQASGSEMSTACIDSLCAQRLALLNLIQIAKLNINKLSFISNQNTLAKIIERINQTYNNNGTQPKSTSSRQSKPPRAVKTNASDLFFIEYHFPVVANSRDNRCDGNLMATQAMRVMAKKARAEVTNDDTVPFEHQADYSVLFNSQSLENWWRSCITFKIFCRSTNASSLGKKNYKLS